MIKIKATIDRVEGMMAVLITKEDPHVIFNLPISFLGDIREGDILDITIKKDQESTRADKERVSSLIEKLKNKSKLDDLNQ